ncbi:MAG TPA: DUF3800 domain-containing protein [Longimicrobium sp.]|nr:DUF3800 domain-containing protein [Longimicrobium sp.]
MYLVFTDGSGNTGMQLDHPTSTSYHLVALAVHGSRARALEDDATNVLARYFGDQCRCPGFECKGSDLYRGQGPCATMRPADRVALYGELLGLLQEHGASLMWVCIDKPRLARRYATPMHPHKLAFIFLVEQIEKFLRQRRDYGLIVSDEEKEMENQVIEDLSRYKEIGTSFGFDPVELTRVVDNVHWVRSHNSRLMQLADLCAYLCQRRLRDQGKDSASAGAVRQLWDGVKDRVWSEKIFPR